MRAVVQRVSQASVVVQEEQISAIGPGVLILLGITHTDGEDEASLLARKIAHLRIFPDAEGKLNWALGDIGGAALVVSQFTLFADLRKGRRPSFIRAARPDKADELYRAFCAEVRGQGIEVETGRFQEHMDIELINDGPVTLLVDSRKEF